MKKLLAFLLAFSAFFSSVSADMILEYDGEQHRYSGSVYKLVVNGKKVQTPLEPIIFNDRALVPVREVFEAMGATVTYIPSTREITIKMGDDFISMQIGSKYVFVSGNRKEFPDGVMPKLIAKKGESAKTMVPVRFVSESLGMNVAFDGNAGVISINNPAQEVDEEITYSSTITQIRTVSADDEVTISVTFSEKPEKISELTMIKSSGVLYLDVFGADYTTSNNITVGKGAVKAVRLGQHEEYTRIAIDTEGADSYYKKLSSDGAILKINISGEGVSDVDEPTSSPSASPSPSTTPEASPSPSPTPTPAPTPTPEAHIKGEKIIVLDAGHGGSDPGAVYNHDGDDYKEKVINLAVAKKVRDILQNNGIRVEMTRSGDTYPSLSERSAFANKLGAAMFVSIHSNSFPSNTEVAGIEVYYSKTNNSDRYGLNSKKLASDIYKQMISATKAAQRGVKTEQHVVTRTSEMPAVLIELGFITNKDEALNLYSPKYQDLLAGAIADAILANMDTVKIPPAPMPAIAADTTTEEITNEDE